MKLQNQITSLVVSTAFALANANSVGGPGYAAYNGNNYRQQGQQQGQEGWHGQPRHQTYGQQPEMTVEEDATEEPPLPSGWSEHFDPNSGQYYYYNSEDGTTTWDKPVTESSDVQLQNENDGKGDMVEGGLTSQKVEEAVPVSEAKDFRAEDVSQQGNQEGQSYGQNSWGVQDASRTPDNRQSDDWEAKKQSQPLLQQEEQLDPLISTNTENLKDTLQPQSQPQEWNGNRVQQQQERQGGVQGTGSFDGQRPSQQFPERQEQGSGSGSPPPSGGWGLPNDQTSPQPSQRSSEWMDPTRDQSQLQSALGVARANVQNNESEQPQNQNLKDQPRPSTPQWGVPNPAKQGGDVPRPEGARPLSPNNTMPAPRAFTRHTVEQPVGHYPQHQSSTDRPPTNKIQDAGQGQQQVPPIGQIPPQAQRPTYGSGQANQYGQPPIQRFDGQYPHYNSPQQYGQYGGQHPGYGQQVVGESGSTLEDSTAVVKDALGKSWQGILGFSNRTRDAMGQARDQVVTGASAASQTLSEKSTSIWGQAKSAFGSVFEKSDDVSQTPYTMSNQYNPNQNYPGRYGSPPGQNMQQGQYGSPPPVNRPSQGQSQQINQNQYPAGRYGAPPGPNNQRQGGQYPAQQMRPGGPPMQPRSDAPYPHQSQTGGQRTRGPYQAQYGNQRGYPPAGGPTPHQAQRGPPPQGNQQQGQKQPDPWSHPGLSGDM